IPPTRTSRAGTPASRSVRARQDKNEGTLSPHPSGEARRGPLPSSLSLGRALRARRMGCPCASTSRNDAALFQAGDRLPVIAELEQDLLGVLAALRGRSRRRPARRREVD